MKHIRLFEQFLNEATVPTGEFQFFPFDKQGSEFANLNLPETATLKDLIAMGSANLGESEVFEGVRPINEREIPDIAWQPTTGTGLYIEHEKTSDGGFGRLVVRSINPLKFDIAFFDREYKKVVESDGVTKGSLPEVQQSTGLGFVSKLKEAFPESYAYLKSEGSDTAARIGGFGWEN